MEIKTARFVISLPEYGKFPGMGLPQLAISGRSNVGKSSLINALCRAGRLAKISGTPGKTRMLNIFVLNEMTGDALHLVDLPGYGFAKVDKAEKRRWGDMMQGYFAASDLLRGVVQLVDIRHEPSRDDIDMVAFLRASAIPFQVVATKADKISRGARMKHIAPVCRALQVQPWEIIPWSSETGEGRDALLRYIGEMVS